MLKISKNWKIYFTYTSNVNMFIIRADKKKVKKRVLYQYMKSIKQSFMNEFTNIST